MQRNRADDWFPENDPSPHHDLTPYNYDYEMTIQHTLRSRSNRDHWIIDLVMITIFHYRHISMIGWWILIVFSMHFYQHLTIVCPSGVCERCCTYRLMRTQVNALQSQCVCQQSEWVWVCVTHLEVLIRVGLSDMLQEFTAGLTHITRCLQEVLSWLKTS